MSYDSIDLWWWPFAFIFFAGILPTAIWRWAGALLVGNLQENSPILLYIRCVATALVAAVIAQLIFYPSGALSDVPLAVRLAASLGGIGLFFVLGRRMIVGILASQLLLVLGALLF